MYRPLDRSRREIRLIKLLNLDATLFVTETIESDPILQRDPDRVRSIEDDIPVRCAISHVSLEDKPVYVTLSYTVGDLFEAPPSVLWTFPFALRLSKPATFRQSYCHVEEKYADLKDTKWGDPSNKRRIILEEGHEYELLVTKSLHSAMRQIAVDAQFWVDAVCINQGDDIEKSWQVQQMWAIFQGGQRTAAWLGLAADDSDLVLAQIADFANLQASKYIEYLSLGGPRKFVDWRPSADFLSLFAFSALIKRPYWRRVWIQHELQASQDVWFYCGRKNIRLKLVNDVLNILHKMHADRELSAVPRDSFEATLGSLKTDESMLITSAAIKLHVLKRRKGNETLAGLLKGAYIFRRVV